MARAKAKKVSLIANLKRKGIDPASKGLTPEGDPLPDPTVIDLAAEDAGEDAEGGTRQKNRACGAGLHVPTGTLEAGQGWKESERGTGSGGRRECTLV